MIALGGLCVCCFVCKCWLLVIAVCLGCVYSVYA